jgi:hypothetical protein
MANPNPPPPPVATQFKPGQTGNPGGKPVATRNRIQTNFLNTLAADFDKHGKKAIEDAREKDPMGYVKALVALMPKQFEQTQPLDDLTDAELTAGIALLQSKVAANPSEGAVTPQEPQQTH